MTLPSVIWPLTGNTTTQVIHLFILCVLTHFELGLDRNFLPLYANNAPQPFPAEGPTHHAPSVKELPNPFFIPNLENRDNVSHQC